MSTSYEMIEPLIAEAAPHGTVMTVTFRCPVTGQSVESSAPLRGSDGLGQKAVQSATRSLMWSVRSAVSSAVRRALGHGIAGRVASDVAQDAMSGVSTSARQSYSESDKRDAIVRAFGAISGAFVWDEANRRFISGQAAGEVMTDFMRQLGAAPVTSPYDRGVLARILIEIACADGGVGHEEREFLAGFLTPDIGTVDSLAAMPRLSHAELDETARSGSRETMLMLAWALALTDESLAPQEAARLDEYAAGLGIAPPRAQELKKWSQVYLVDQALGRAYPDGRRDMVAHAEIMAMARQIGLNDSDAERVDIRYRKRYGLMP